jgi:hypothetical protein
MEVTTILRVWRKLLVQLRNDIPRLNQMVGPLVSGVRMDLTLVCQELWSA